MLATSARPARTLRARSHLLLVLAALAGAACGGAGSGPGGADAGSSASGGPDVGLAQQQLLESVAEGHARFAEFKESGRQQDGAGEFQSLVVSFKGVLEFTGDCYYNKERKAGDRVPFEAEIEYAQGPDGWQKLAMGLYPLETP